MAADYLISSLQPLDIDGTAPCTMARFLEQCRDQLPAAQAGDIADAVAPERPVAAPRWAVAAQWRDLEDQIRNAVAAERARARGLDPAKWRHPVAGCSLFWANRVAAALTYAIRLAIVLRRQALSAKAGNEVFNRLTAATKLEF